MDTHADGQGAWHIDRSSVFDSDYQAFLEVATGAFETDWFAYWGIGHEYAPASLDPDLWENANRLYADAQRICEILYRSPGRRTPPHLRELRDKLQHDNDREVGEWLKEAEEIEALGDESAVEEHCEKWLDAPMRLALFDTSMDLWASAYFGTSPRDLAVRAVDVVRSMIRVKGEATRQYLGRVAVCYIHDMGPELAVMARAVIESALQSCDLESHVDTIVRTQGKRYPGLGDWIEAARMDGLLPPEAHKAAVDVKRAGDDVIHNVPQQAPEASVTMTRLTTVLEAIDDATKL